MLTIALTSIPPRFEGLGPVLAALLDQGADRVVLTIPDSYARFPDWTGALPDLPPGITLLRGPDLGPASKYLAPLRAFPDTDMLLIADDDWLYARGWARAFQEAAEHHPDAAIAASAFDISRLGLPGPGRIVQGFAGVLIRPGLFDPSIQHIPEAIRPVDDIWLSAHLARRGIPIRPLPAARALAIPAKNEAAPLQSALFKGKSRADLNRKAAHDLARTLGIWQGSASSSGRKTPGFGAEPQSE